jgi:hypothetical protein
MMRTTIKIDSLKQAETVINRLARRARKLVVGLAPAVSIYSYCPAIPEDKVLLRYLFPVAGTFKKVLIKVPGTKPDKLFPVHIEIIGSTTGQYFEGQLRKETTTVPLNFAIEEGTSLQVTTTAEGVTGIEVAALFVPLIDTGERHTALADALEGVVDEGV